MARDFLGLSNDEAHASVYGGLNREMNEWTGFPGRATRAGPLML